MGDEVRGGAADALTDVAGLRVGHAQRAGDGWLTGVTVVLAPEGGAVDRASTCAAAAPAPGRPTRSTRATSSERSTRWC